LSYASWPRRAAAFVLDALPVAGLAALAFALLYLTRNRLCDGDPSSLDLGDRCGNGTTVIGQVGYLVAWLAVIGYGVWNFGYRQGRTGSSIGKSAVCLRVVDVASGEPIGFWRSAIRQLAHVLDLLSLSVGYLWPLWDSRNQTFADKLASTVCVYTGVSGTR
jgi:uncharacterized RDD family membrane protein YckC